MWDNASCVGRSGGFGARGVGESGRKLGECHGGQLTVGSGWTRDVGYSKGVAYRGLFKLHVCQRAFRDRLSPQQEREEKDDEERHPEGHTWAIRRGAACQ